MGHDIYAVNRLDEEVGYMRFSMSNMTSYDFYELFDAMDYHGGVSGVFKMVEYTVEQIEAAERDFFLRYGKVTPTVKERQNDFTLYERYEMKKFIQNCLKTAQQEGSVRIQYC